MSTIDPRITAYRAAAAKLTEAVATHGNSTMRCLADARVMFGSGDPLEMAIAHLSWDYDPHRTAPYQGWRYLVEAVRLRLMSEAEILEQENDDTYPRHVWLGDIVRAWREGVTRNE